MRNGDFIRQFEGEEMGRVRPIFFMESVEDKAATAEAGRPIFKDVEMVRIQIPGDIKSEPVQKVTDLHRHRWPDHYQAFTGAQEAAPIGTPLEQWGRLPGSRIEELKFFKIRTVEDLAGVPDGLLQNLGMGARELRAEAQAFLEVQQDGAAAQKYAVQLEQQQDQISLLQNQIAQIQHHADEAAAAEAELKRLRSENKTLQAQLSQDPGDETPEGGKGESMSDLGPAVPKRSRRTKSKKDTDH